MTAVLTLAIMPGCALKQAEDISRGALAVVTVPFVIGYSILARSGGSGSSSASSTGLSTFGHGARGSGIPFVP